MYSSFCLKIFLCGLLRPNTKINVFRVTGLKILGRVGIHIFFSNYLLSWKKYNFIHFERHFAFQNAKIIYFPENLKKIIGLASKFR